MFRDLLKWVSVLVLMPIALMARDPVAYVVNTSGETLSKINLKTGAAENDILPIGSDVFSYPSQIVVRDTLAYVIASGTDEIQIIDLVSETTVDFISTGSGSSPFWMAFFDSQYVYVTSFANNSVAKVDVISGAVIDEKPVGPSPEGIIIRDFKAYIAVTAFDPVTWQFGQGRVVIYDTWSDQVLTELDVGTNPQYFACDTAGNIHVVCTGDYWSSFGMVYVIDPQTDIVADSFSIGGSPGNITIGADNIAYVAAGGWVTDGYVFSYNAITGDVYYDADNPLVVDYGCVMAVAYQDSTAFIGTFTDFVARIDSAGSVLDRFAVGDGPVHLAVNYIPADLTGDFEVDIADLLWMVEWYFNSGLPPHYPRWRANVNGDFEYDISDMLYLVEYMFNHGSAPKVGPAWVE